MPQAFADEFKSFPISGQLGESLERARRFAREQSHRLVTLEHLLLALTEDSEATVMLEAANIDLARLRADVSAYLGGLLEDMRAQGEATLAPDADLLRVLKAATTAAQQSRWRHRPGRRRRRWQERRRRPVDGARLDLRRRDPGAAAKRPGAVQAVDHTIG